MATQDGRTTQDAEYIARQQQKDASWEGVKPAPLYQMTAEESQARIDEEKSAHATYERRERGILKLAQFLQHTYDMGGKRWDDLSPETQDGWLLEAREGENLLGGAL